MCTWLPRCLLSSMTERPTSTPSRGLCLRGLSACGLALLMTACALSPAAPSQEGTVNLSVNLQFCTDEINRYRASIGRPPLVRSEALETFAATAAEHDHTAGVPHQYFRTTNGGGVATAETELLLWKGYSVRDVIKEGLGGMWTVGPGGSHYATLAGSYREVGCGIYVNGAAVTIAQDFR